MESHRERCDGLGRRPGCAIEWPFHNFAFTAVVGELPILKMCDRGLFDVAKREHLSTIVEED